MAVVPRNRLGHPCGLAVYTDVRADPGHPLTHHSAVPSGVSGMAGQEIGGHLAATFAGGTFRPRSAADDDRHDDYVCVQLWRGFRGNSADAADRATIHRSESPGGGKAGP